MPFQCVFAALHSLIFFNMVGLSGGIYGWLLFTLAIVLLANTGAALGFLVSGATGSTDLSLSIMPGAFLRHLGGGAGICWRCARSGL